MGLFSNTEKLNNVDKLALQLVGTGNDAPGAKWFYNEAYGYAPISPPARNWAKFDSIPGAANVTVADANVLANPGIMEKRKIRTTLDTTTNNRGYICRTIYGDHSSPIHDNWIPPGLIRNSGDASWGYAVRLFHGDPDAGGVELSTTYRGGAGGAPSWSFNYAEGILVISTDESAYYRTNHYDVNGLWILGYRYIGASGGSGGGMALDVVQANTFVQGDAVYFDGVDWQLALADDEDTLGVGLIDGPSPTGFSVIFGGPISGLVGLVAGQYYFVSDTVAGALTVTEPIPYSNPLLLATSATEGIVLPFRPSTSGLLTVVLPEVTTVQRIALTPAAISGTLVIDTDLQKVFRKSGSIWVEV